MGTYFVDIEKTEILAFINKFAREEGLGKVCVQERLDLDLKVCAPASFDLWRPKYIWFCKDEVQGCSIKLRIRPPILRFIGLFISFSLLAAGTYTLGILFIIRGLHAIEHEAFSFGLTLAVMAFFLLCGLRYLHTKGKIMVFEGLFASRLKDFFPRVKQSPMSGIFTLGTWVFLSYIPFALLFAGLVRAVPIWAVLVAPCFASVMALVIADIAALQSPWSAWRVMLLSWISRWTILNCFIFIGFSFFNFVGTTMSVLLRIELHEPLRTYELISEAFGPHFWGAARNATSQSILGNNAAIFQQVMVKWHVGVGDPILEFDLAWRIMVCGVIILMLGAAKGLIDWMRTWLTVRPSQKATLSPPSGLRRTSSQRAFDSLVMGLSLLFAAVGNIFHLLLTVEILSVVCFDRAFLNPSVAQAIGWLEIDLVAAAEGNVCRHAIGTILLMIFTLPTMVTVLAWFSYLVRHTVILLRCRFSRSVDEDCAKSVQKLSSTMSIRTPTLCVLDRKGSYFLTRIPWFFSRSTILISPSTLESLSKSELEAAIVHELSHLKHDAVAIRLTRWLSLLSLFSCNAFALLLDMESREMRADNAAIKIVGDSQTLAKALVKVSLAQAYTSDAKTAGLGSKCLKGPLTPLGSLWTRIVDRVSLLGLLLHPEAIIGYTHPRIQDRLMVLAKSRKTTMKHATSNKVAKGSR